MRSVALRLCAILLLAAPTALAFVSGGYFAEPRLWAALAVWALVVIVAVAAPEPLPRRPAGIVALAALLLLAVWTLASTSWAPLAGPAWQDAQRLALYAGALAAAVALLRDRGSLALVEPALCAGALAVAVYGLSERLLPGAIDLDDTLAAFGRLEQPLTYWNAMGSVAAVGAVLAIRLAGTRERAPVLRVGAAVALPWLGAALYLTLSRGALLALAVGLAALLAFAPTRPQLRAVVLGALTIAAASVAAELLPELGGVSGDLAARERQGAAMLAVLAIIAAIAGAFGARAVRGEESGALSLAALRRPPPWAVAGAAILALAAAGTVATGGDERPSGDDRRASAERLRSVESNRYDYWRVALAEAVDEPLRGGGSGSFRVAWLRERDVPEIVQDAHSLTLETVAELGLVGLALVLAFVGAVAASGRRALRLDPVLAPGAAAGFAAWLVHAQIDWLWEMPAATLPALLLAASLVASSESAQGEAEAPAGARRDASLVASSTAATAASTTTGSSAA